MNIPVHSGNTSLAYVTEEERKLLRRRDAVKGSPNKKMSHGIPRLEGGGGWDFREDERIAKEIRAKEDALRKAGFEIRRTVGGGEGGTEKWVHVDKGLSAGGLGAPSTPIKYGTGYDEVISIKTMGGTPVFIPPKTTSPAPTSTKPAGKKSKPKKKKKTPTGPGFGWIDDPIFPEEPKKKKKTPTTTSPAPTSTEPKDSSAVTDTAKDHEAYIENATIDASQLQQPMLDEIVADGVNSELLETRLTNLINKNNPLFKAATTKALQSMAARGLVNSSIAEEAVMNAILSVAMPIAERDANAYLNQRMQNQAYSNEFRMQQNQAYYAQFLQKLQHSMDMVMRQLVERSANWRAVLAEDEANWRAQLGERSANWRAVLAARSRITTTPGMGTDASSAALGTVTPGWWA